MISALQVQWPVLSISSDAIQRLFSLEPLYLCHMGIQIIFFLDDSIIIACSRSALPEHRDFVLKLMEHLGFMVNMENSNLTPSQKFSFLGLCWNTKEGAVSLEVIKVSKL